MFDPSYVRLLRPFAWLLLSVLLLEPACLFGQSNWTSQASGTPDFLSASGFGAGVFVTVGESGTVLSSPDAMTWTSRSSGTTEALRGVAFGSGTFVAVGNNGTVLSSTNGLNWTAQSSGTTSFLSGIVFGAGRFVAVGGAGAVITSTDGITWATAPSVDSRFLQGISYGGGRFVAVGSSGAILSSTDGLTWAVESSATSAFLTGIAYFGGKYFAVGQFGTVLSSSDASTWATESSGTLSWLRAATTDGTQLVLVGDGGTIVTSLDGANFSPTSSGVTSLLSGVFFGNGLFLAVGEPGASSGVILSAERDPGIRWAVDATSADEDAGSLTLTLERNGSTAAVATVEFLTVEGTATADVDFTATSGTATFGIGVASAEVMVALINNPQSEPAETFQIMLQNPDPNNLLLHPPASVSVTIIDAQDSDFDGLPDDWEVEHFGDVSLFGPDDDPDADNNSNSRELADGTDPDDANSASYSLSVSVPAGNGTVTKAPELPSYSAGQLVTLTPTGTGEFTFTAWSGDVTGTQDPLPLTMDSDKVISATFVLSLEAALDGDGFAWVTGGTGSPWAGQSAVTAGGFDAAQVGGLSIGQKSSVESVIHGPATVTFLWKISTNQFDSLRFSIDSSPQATLNGGVDWTAQSFPVGAGTHTLSWVYARNSTLSGGTNEAWLDEVAATFTYDDWARAFFSAAQQADPAISGPAADPDADGFENIREFVHDTNPRVRNVPASDRLALTEVMLEGESHLGLTWQQHKKRAPHVQVTVEASDTLLDGSWQALAASLEVLSEQGAVQTVRMIDPQSEVARRFYRLSYSLLP